MRFFDPAAEGKGEGFAHFSPAHLLWLAGGVLLVALLCVLYRRGTAKRRRIMRPAVTLTAMALQLSRAGLFLAAGEYGLTRLPLHLCSLFIYLAALHALRPGELLGQFLYAFCFPGAVFALLFPDWTGCPPWHFLTLCAFLVHFLPCGYVLMRLFAGELQAELRKAPACLGLMAGLALPVYAFDRLTNTNYMFLNWPSPASPLEWFAFLGRPGYLLGYVPLLAGVWLLLYLPPALARRNAKNDGL